MTKNHISLFETNRLQEKKMRENERRETCPTLGVNNCNNKSHLDSLV